VAVTLSMTNVIREDIEFRVKHLLVIDIIIEDGGSSGHVDSL